MNTKIFDELKWYELIHDFNGDKIKMFNIFNSLNFRWGVERAVKNYTTYEKFKDDIKGSLMYSFGYKVEYEIACSGLFEKSERHKIDVYYQVLPNLDILTNYIFETVNKHKRKKLER